MLKSLFRFRGGYRTENKRLQVQEEGKGNKKLLQ